MLRKIQWRMCFFNIRGSKEYEHGERLYLYERIGLLRKGKVVFLSTLEEKGFVRGKEDILFLSPSTG
jgi:hypothetical protein